MNCIITAGPTFEPLDKVRRLTNFSTGRLGSELASFLAARGHSVTLLRGEQSTYRENDAKVQTQIFTTTEDLRSRLQQLAGSEMGAVFHAAAVSDFAFGRILHQTAAGELHEIKSGKISSRLEGLLAELKPTIKIIGLLREYFPNAFLAGWKYEVEGDRHSVLEQARLQIERDRTNACVANGPAYGFGFGLVTAIREPMHLRSATELFESLAAGCM